MTIKKIDVISTGKLTGFIYAIFGLIAGLLFAPFMLFISKAPPYRGEPSIFPFIQGLGIAFIFLAPIIYGVMGFVMGCIVALLYNLGAKFMGGIKLDLE